MSKTKDELQKEAKDLGLEIQKDGKDLTVEELKSVIREANLENQEKTIKVKFTKGPTGKFLLPYSVGQEKELPETQAKELIANGYAEKV
ncbi:hypothetical protein [Flagellimonas sp.]|uniref:hypothetical protein n=1 Tax=Flagellimonas sp. TaxID=2058762 RepID=UPI003F49C4AA